VDDWDGLENRCGGNSTVGSNPTPSAISQLIGVMISPWTTMSVGTMSNRQRQPSK
jgi:hypothetical protein